MHSFHRLDPFNDFLRVCPPINFDKFLDNSSILFKFCPLLCNLSQLCLSFLRCTLQNTF